MRKILSVIGLAAGLALAGCQSGPTDPMASKMVYRGVLPCADCSGIRTTLTLYRDQDANPSRYELNQQYLDGSKVAGRAIERGAWADDRITIDNKSYPVYTLNPEAEEAQHRFLQSATNAVEMLDLSGQRIDSDLNYTLMKQ